LFNDEKDIYNAHIENPKESPNVSNCSNQEERRRDKTSAHTINVHTSVGKSQVAETTPA